MIGQRQACRASTVDGCDSTGFRQPRGVQVAALSVADLGEDEAADLVVQLNRERRAPRSFPPDTAAPQPRAQAGDHARHTGPVIEEYTALDDPGASTPSIRVRIPFHGQAGTDQPARR